MFNRIIALLKKEFILIFNNRQSRMLIIIPPLLQLLIFGYAVTMEVKNINMGVLDKCCTVESRELVACFAASPSYKKIVYYYDHVTAQSAMANSEVNCVLIINEDFSRNLVSNHSPSVEVLLDGRQLNSASIINGYTNNIVSIYAQSYYKNSVPIEIVVRNWFNVNLDYRWMILSSIFTMLSTLPCLLLTSMSIVQERELGTFEQLTVSPLQPLEILIGKTIPPFLIGFLLSLIMIIPMSFIFNLPFTGSIFLLVLSLFIALLSVSGIGLFISSICRTQQQALFGVFTYQMPAILLSGFISAVEDMPYVFQKINMLNPLQYYVVITKGLFLKNMSMHAVLQNLYPMIIIACCTLSIATFMFKRKLE